MITPEKNEHEIDLGDVVEVIPKETRHHLAGKRGTVISITTHLYLQHRKKMIDVVYTMQEENPGIFGVRESYEVYPHSVKLIKKGDERVHNEF